ncbi:hypothetical protein M501DRAFT_995848 [Patellaria atrata CBS 101060]|uniref:F-box domain-containing protein n=1 Tax=Patellaria atrata CBS 101060 TaxID=1346257 RepID=A0A9P4VPG4_9PEZI|nr:hypothetical protein M501DRAFT_995848 [Patellaria atrata CBS 101060]
MSFNWINHPVSQHSHSTTSEDLKYVLPARIDDFFERVKWLFLIRSALPATLEERFRDAYPVGIFAILLSVIKEDHIMDTDLLQEYKHSIEEVSVTMRGFPKVCISQWSAVRAHGFVYTARKTSSSNNRAGNPNQYFSGPFGSPPSQPTTFLDLPDSIRDRIYRFLFFRDNITISDWGISPTRLDSLRQRTEYDILVRGKEKRTTYVVVPDDADTSPVCLNIMRVNRKINAETSKLFYQHKFRFRGSGQSAVAFLHDRMQKLKLMERIQLHFTTSPKNPFRGLRSLHDTIPLAPRTWLTAWRLALNVFVHRALGLVDLDFTIDSGFWTEAPWQRAPPADRATEIFQHRQILCQSIKTVDMVGGRNFLQHVARLGGVNIRLEIEGTEGDPERKTLQRELEKVIQAAAADRPYLAHDELPRCTCRRRLLSESCIWDREGKNRRA